MDPSLALGIINGAVGLATQESHKDDAERQYQYQLQLMKTQNEYNKESVERQISGEKEMYEYTGPASKVRQLKEAGLNPGLIYGMGGSSGGVTGNVSAPGVSGGNAPIVSQTTANKIAQQGMLLNLSKLQSEIELNESAAQVNKANAALTGTNTQVRNIDLEIANALKEWNKVKGANEAEITSAELGLALNRNRSANANANVDDALQDVRIQHEAAELLRTKAQTKLTEDQSNQVIQSVLQKWQDIGNDRTRIENELELRLKEMNTQINQAWIHAAASMISKIIPSTVNVNK